MVNVAKFRQIPKQITSGEAGVPKPGEALSFLLEVLPKPEVLRVPLDGLERTGPKQFGAGF